MASAATSVIVVTSLVDRSRFSIDSAHRVTSRIPSSTHQSMSSSPFSAPFRWPSPGSA